MSFLTRSLLASAVGLVVSLNAQAATELTVYTAVESDDLQKYAERF